MNEFKKGEKFKFDAEVEYASGSIVSKNVLKNSVGNVSLFAFDKNEGLSEHTAPFDAMLWYKLLMARLKLLLMVSLTT